MKKSFILGILLLFEVNIVAQNDMSNFKQGKFFENLAKKHMNDIKNLNKAKKFYKLACSDNVKDACSSFKAINEALKYLNDNSYKIAKEKLKTGGLTIAGESVVYYQLRYGKLGYEIKQREKALNKKNGMPNVFNDRCKACHGSKGNKKAMGTSKILQKMTKKEIVDALHSCKNGTHRGSFKSVVTGQAKGLSNQEIEDIANAIAKHKTANIPHTVSATTNNNMILSPDRPLWIEIIYLNNHSKKSYILDRNFTIDLNRNQIITTGHTGFKIYLSNGSSVDIKQGNDKHINILVKDSKISKISDKMFKKLNGGSLF